MKNKFTFLTCLLACGIVGAGSSAYAACEYDTWTCAQMERGEVQDVCQVGYGECATETFMGGGSGGVTGGSGETGGTDEGGEAKDKAKGSSDSGDEMVVDLSALDSVCPNHPLVCLAFAPCAAAPVCPVVDVVSNPMLLLLLTQEKLGYVVSTFHKSMKSFEVSKFSIQERKDISRTLNKYTVPEIEDYKTGSDSAVDAYRGKMPGMDASTVDFEDDKETTDVLKDAIVVATGISPAEKTVEKERKNAFIQQSILDLLARVLYYKTELNKLRDLDAEIQSTLGLGDTVGTFDVSERMKDADARVQALEEKILAMRIEVQAIKNFTQVDAVNQDINVQ